MSVRPSWRRLAPLLLLCASPVAQAYDYGTAIIVRSEADIIELEYMGEIDEEMRDQLLDLFDNPIDLNTASREDLVLLPEVTYSIADRIIEHRKRDPFDTERQLRAIVGPSIWSQVKPFVTTMKVPEPPDPMKGSVHARYYDAFDDGKPPMSSLKAKVRYHRWFEAGVLVAEEQGPYGVSYDNDTITVEGVRPLVSLERVYATVDRGGWAVMMGHYKAGFGQRLTFDVTDKQRPHGFYQDLRITEDSEGYDSYSVSRRLLGVAASTERQLGDEGPRLDLTVFASSNPHDLYYTYFSPHDYTVTSEDEVKYPTFPWVYREDILGLNSTLFWSKRVHAGFTGWGGHVSKAYDFDFTNTPIPNRDFYGALGVDGAYGQGFYDIFGEVALTDTGGLGARAEAVVDPGMIEASVAMRYYGEGFDNPHSRGKSEPDQYSKDESLEDYDYIISGGDRDRDEIGPQVQVIFDPYGWIRLRVKGDVWKVPSEDLTHGYFEGRLDLDPIDYVGLDVVAYRRDKDMSVGGRDQDYDDSDGKGCKNALGATLTLRPVETLTVQATAKQVWEDSSSYEGFMKDRYVWGKVIWDILEDLEVAGRVKVYDERIDADQLGSEYWSAYGEARGKLFGKLTLFARYEQINALYTEEYAPSHKLKVGSDFRF
jgi:hypothetical protein